MYARFLTALVTSSIAVTSLAAQTPSAAQEPQRPDLTAELQRWRDDHGPDWRLRADSRTGFARFLYGGSLAPILTPRNEADYFSLARNVTGLTRDLHGIDGTTLVEESVVDLPLASAGSSDKVAVRLRQEVRGVPVVGGLVNVLMSPGGAVLAIDNQALPGVEALDLRPGLEAERARRIAAGWFREETGMPPLQVGAARLVVDAVRRGGARVGVLAWEVEARREESGGFQPEGWLYRVDAQDGTLVSREGVIHECFGGGVTVTGNVESMLTPGIAPDSGTNPPVTQSLPHLTVSYPGGSVTTDANGDFSIPNQTLPVNVTVTYDGLFTTTNDQGAGNFSLTTPLNSASGNVITMNATPSEQITAQANSYNWIARLRDYTRGVNAADATADFNATSNTNISLSCNAFYNGFSVNFYTSGGGCANTSFSTVVVHEMGHWLNDLYGNNNGGDGMGEGGADIFSIYTLDSPIVGQDFFGVGTQVRDANNTRQYWGDANEAPYGSVHRNGETLMGAFWKMRANLKADLGDSLGAMTADVLHNSWRLAFAESSNTSTIQDQLLSLDDDDADLGNGTPNLDSIDAAFFVQGYPGFDLISFSNVTTLPDTQDETGPYLVNADIVPELNGPIAAATVHYELPGFGFLTRPMTNVSGDTWSGDIPGQTSPFIVRWYVSAQDANGNTRFFPTGGQTRPNSFKIGNVTTVYFDDFEGVDDNGWTHAQVANQDDWQRGIPNGSCGDPSSAFSGSNVWGNDLAPSGFNGCYQPDVDNYLRSPALDLSAASGTHIGFMRRLGVEKSSDDQARIRVNGTEVWVNSTSTDHYDSDWTLFELDVSSLADGNAAVEFEFAMQSDPSVQSSGWTIDDFRVFTLEASDPTLFYCTGKTTSQGCVPFLSTAGSGVPSISDTNAFSIRGNDHVANEVGILVYGFGKANLNFHGGKLCVKSPLVRTAGKTAKNKAAVNCAGPTSTGRLTTDFNNRIQGGLDPLLTVGQKVYAQWQQRDPANTVAGFSDNLSDGVRFTILP